MQMQSTGEIFRNAIRLAIIVLVFMPACQAACHDQHMGSSAAPSAFAASRLLQTPLGLSLSQRHTCSLRASGDEDAPSTMTQATSPKTRRAVRHRRQGRVIGRLLYKRLEEELQEASELGKDVAENLFDSSVNVVVWAA
jgi:hypothetical protein